ncbi:MAG: CDP-alcohol phosphatidyltransferase family protein [Anaerolineae bacterium]|nr:CDP-alcohol phosphatidyltransferase family protein [Anaerolineae bacterium]
MEKLPNYITFSRIPLALSLFFTTPLNAAFYLIYGLCGLSDFLDGFIARKTGTTSEFGAKLDSLADLIMMGVLLFMLYPVVSPSTNVIVWIIVIAVIRLISVLTIFKRYKTFAVLHTYGNKITGILIFLFPVFLLFLSPTLLLYGVCLVASISAVEELLINLTSSELRVNRGSIFDSSKL